ncbi:hypothetical protein QJS66_19280 [Kocuria rhizophila]|nr:hypothetical protein QJS66_19280 [Kocuria rhizophila]
MRAGAEIDRTRIRFPRYHRSARGEPAHGCGREDGPGHSSSIRRSAGSGQAELHCVDRPPHGRAPHGRGRTGVRHRLRDRGPPGAGPPAPDAAVDQLVDGAGQFQPITSGSEGSKTGSSSRRSRRGFPSSA